MKRIVQTFTCIHENPSPPVEIKTRGHSAVEENRFCVCTGVPKGMVRKVKHYEPHAESLPQ